MHSEHQLDLPDVYNCSMASLHVLLKPGTQRPCLVSVHYVVLHQPITFKRFHQFHSSWSQQVYFPQLWRDQIVNREPKKTHQTFFVVSSTKPGRFWSDKIGHQRIFCAKYCKRLPRQPNNVLRLRNFEIVFFYFNAENPEEVKSVLDMITIARFFYQNNYLEPIADSRVSQAGRSE